MTEALQVRQHATIISANQIKTGPISSTLGNQYVTRQRPSIWFEDRRQLKRDLGWCRRLISVVSVRGQAGVVFCLIFVTQLVFLSYTGNFAAM